MEERPLLSYHAAVEDFREARRQAALETLVARLRGRSANLLPFETVRQKLRAVGGKDVGLQDIPLDAIVGSVGRYTDFTRSFLPKGNVDPHRWAQVNQKAAGLRGLPPIEVYKVGEAYFVKDGNHRVSVARRNGAHSIQAYVTEVQTRVPLAAGDDIDDLILKAEYVRFLERVPIDRLRPKATVMVTEPGQYDLLEEHIRVHRYFLGLEKRRGIPWEEAVVSWYDKVYLPVVRIIRREGLLRHFPGRTETDLYLWLAEHQRELQEKLGWEVSVDETARGLHQRLGHRLRYWWEHTTQRVYDLLVPDPMESGPSPGTWRQEKQRSPDAMQAEDHLFGTLLIPIKGDDDTWEAVTQAARFGQRDGSILRGLHVVSDEHSARLLRPQMLQSAFVQHCNDAGVSGSLSIAVGDVQREICNRARWVDLVVVRLRYPPGPRVWQRWRSGFRTLLRRCPRPILAVPGQATKMERALLAFDHTPKAREALYVSAYLAAKWGTHLTVLSVKAPLVKGKPLDDARAYLEKLGISAAYVQDEGNPAERITHHLQHGDYDLLLIGSYNRSPLREILLGSVLESVLQRARIPVLICR